jgi:hypothetical protein|tara:strand:+ start:157 stop:561 length:405 start_codon:yes stop_codon:yes gene_type:complete
MKSIKNYIRAVLKSRLDVSYRIKIKEPDREVMNKKIFVEVLDQLRAIEDRKDFLADEIGMDMTQYEDQFFAVIENLFKLAFNKSQLALIQMYLYKLIPDKDWDGMITIEENKLEKDVPFQSPDEVWNVIKKFEK